MPKITQNDCCQSFATLAKDTIDKIDGIDKDTPANPNYPEHEPAWWIDMMEIQRSLRQWRERHAK